MPCRSSRCPAPSAELKLSGSGGFADVENHRRTTDYVNSFFNSKNSIESEPVPVHNIDGAAQRGGADQLAGIMSGFDDLDVGDDGDDLLDMMDAAAGSS